VADELELTFDLPGEPGSRVDAWRASTPPFLADHKRVDESYESLVYEADVTSTFTKFATMGFARTLYRLTFTFRPVTTSAGPGTRVTVVGKAREHTVKAMGRWFALQSLTRPT
jgi:plastocyanin